MAKYHINPETGDPGLCKAKVKCRFGDGEHFDSKADARAAAEKLFASGALGPKMKRHRSYYLNDEAVSELFDRMEEDRFFVNQRARDYALYELVNKEGEHWYSNGGGGEFKIYHHKSYRGESSYEVVNFRNLGGPVMDKFFLLPEPSPSDADAPQAT